MEGTSVTLRCDTRSYQQVKDNKLHLFKHCDCADSAQQILWCKMSVEFANGPNRCFCFKMAAILSTYGIICFEQLITFEIQSKHFKSGKNCTV